MGWKHSYPKANRRPLWKVGGGLLGIGATLSIATAALGFSDLGTTPAFTPATPISKAVAPATHAALSPSTRPARESISYSEEVPCADKPTPVLGPKTVVHRRKPRVHRKLTTPVRHVVVHARPHPLLHRAVRRHPKPLLRPQPAASCEVLHRDQTVGRSPLLATAYYPSLNPIAPTPQAPAATALDRSFSPLDPLNNYAQFPAGGGPSVKKALVTQPVSPAPEPDAWALMLIGVAMVGGTLRLRHKRAGAPLTGG